MIIAVAAIIALNNNNRFLNSHFVRSKHLPTVVSEEVYVSVRYLVQTSSLCKQMSEPQAACCMKMQFRPAACYT
jgi:hypothetical protein